MFKLYRQKRFSSGLLLFFAVCACASSCVSSKNMVYFNDLPDSMSAPVVMTQTTPFTDPKIEPNDMLAITVQTVVQNPGNAPITSTSTGTFNLLNSFMVDKNGYIELSLIGFVKVAGLTTAEAREVIKQKAKELYKEPVVMVRIANFDVDVLGDVARPGRITLPGEKENIIGALSMAGDLNITGKRSNILVVRTEGDQRTFHRVDLRSSKIYQSPVFWLKQHDQIYVEPNKFKVQSSDQTLLRNLGILSTVISMASLILIFRTVK